MQKKVKVKLSSLNPYIMCKLCNGYLVDAATITECLHTFCKSCLMRHVGLVNRCPTCNAIIHETQPLYNIRLDRTMQDIVHKLLPRLDREEKRREKKFYKSRGIPYPLPSLPEVHGSLLSSKKPKSPTAIRTKHVLNVNHRTEDQISLQLELHKTASEQQEALQGIISEEEVDVMTVSDVDKGGRLSLAMHVDHSGGQPNVKEPDGLLDIAILKVFSLSKDNGDQNERKFIHNIREQKRRKDLQGLYTKLQDSVPALTGKGRVAKVQILVEAKGLIDQLVQEEACLLKQLHTEQQCNEELLKKITYFPCQS